VSDANQNQPDSVDSAANKKPMFTLTQLLVIIAVLAMLAGLLLPTLQNAREVTRRSQCLQNLHNSIGAAMRLYSVDHDGWFPCDDGQTTLGSFALLTNSYQTSPARWICPTDAGVAERWDKSLLTPARQIWKASNVSYAYNGFGLTEHTQPDTPIACDRSSGDVRSKIPWATNQWTHKSEGGNVLYADGHVSWATRFTVPMYQGKNP